jgi:hypothetical protein
MSHGIRRLLFTLCFLAGLLTPYLWTRVWYFALARHEVQRVASPDKRLDAVSITIRRGIFTPRLWYEVYIVEHGASFGQADPVFSALKIESAQLAWTAPRQLKISYARARIEHFTNYWKQSPRPEESVEIRLVSSAAAFSYLNSSGGINPVTEP